MDVDEEIKELKDEEQLNQGYPLFCCWPANDSGLKFWGVFLVVVGGIWLLSNLGVTVAIVWPLFVIGLGLLYLGRARGKDYM